MVESQLNLNYLINNENVIENTFNSGIEILKTFFKERLLHEDGKPDEEEMKNLRIYKLIFLIVFFIGNFIAGFFIATYKSKDKGKGLKFFVSYTNTFGAAISLTTSLFIILPRGIYRVTEYFEETGGEEKYGSFVPGFNWCLLTCFFSFSMFLVFQKILFTSVGAGDHGHSHAKSGEEALLGSDKEKELQEQQEDENEEAFKAVVGSRGRFGSFMMIRNIKKSFASEGKEIKLQKRASIVNASMALARVSLINKDFRKTLSHESGTDMDLLVNPQNINIDEKKDSHAKDEAINSPHNHNHQHNNDEEAENDHGHSHGDVQPKTPFMAFVLLGCISFHGFFEGFAIGVSETKEDVVVLGCCILVSKCLEAMSIALILKSSGVETLTILRMLILFIAFAPLGIIIGSFTNINELIRGIFFGICVGSVLYQSISENVVQEFTFTKYRYSKFFTFILGAIIIAVVASLVGAPVVEEDHDHGRLLKFK